MRRFVCRRHLPVDAVSMRINVTYMISARFSGGQIEWRFLFLPAVMVNER